ncbi:Scm3p [Saccharomyces cerevisiae x Saccharomyces kudriavzevii VIN7]|nr:Scm3p [Saccharomyces cerevisiae Lalvin QA23]EHN08206.1 Scm3p [Saccharomyces cerevisiae x Saccharomyces kudriavzevii VIN7]
MSKENHIIPKLTDDEVMERHKLADENMRKVWSNIISKYESIEEQGDLVDLKTGEIVEDNGHIKTLTANKSTKDKRTKYTSVLRDIIDISDEEDGNKNDEYTLWANDSEASDSEVDADNDTEEEKDEKLIDADFKKYEAKLSKRILRD